MVPRKPVVQSFQISRMKQKFRCACNSIFGFSIQSHLVGHMPHPPRGLLEPLVKNIYPVIRICQPQCGQGTAGRICSIFWRFWGPDSNSTPAVRMCAWPFCDIERYSNNPTYQQNHTKPTTPKSIDDSSLPWHAMAMARVKYGMVMPTLLASFLGEDRGSVISTWSRLLGFPNRNGPTALTDIKSIQSILGVHCTRWLNLGRLFFIVNSLEKKLHKEGFEEGSSLSDFQSGMSELSTTTSSNMPSAPKPYCPTWARALASLQIGDRDVFSIHVSTWRHTRVHTYIFAIWNYACKYMCMNVNIFLDISNASIISCIYTFPWLWHQNASSICKLVFWKFATWLLKS